MSPGRSIVDLGGGTCNLWLDFPEDTQLTVIDKSLQMIFVARENIPWANFILDDVLSLDKKRIGKFDVVVSTFTLHHISYDQQEIAIKNIIELCSDNGRILIVDRSFHSQVGKEKKESELAAKGNQEFLEIIRSEYYLLSDHVTNYIRYMGFQVKTLFFEKEIWGFLIEKI
jgi:ubiquinone/menaquinone biosynthesis C-methylase UbiE